MNFGFFLVQFGFCFVVWCSDVGFIGNGVLRLFCYVGFMEVLWYILL